MVKAEIIVLVNSHLFTIDEADISSQHVSDYTLLFKTKQWYLKEKRGRAKRGKRGLAIILKPPFLPAYNQGPRRGWGWGALLFCLIKSLFFYYFSEPGLSFSKRYITLFYVKYADLLGTQPYPDWSISIQFSFSDMARHGQMRQFVIRFVPEQTIRFSSAQ